MDQMAAFGIFGFSLIALYAASTLYRLLPLSGQHSEAAPRGLHGDLRAHSWHLHPLLPARTGRRLADGVA